MECGDTESLCLAQGTHVILPEFLQPTCLLGLDPRNLETFPQSN